MRSELLHVVCAIANPMRWNSRIDIYKAFEQHMLDSGVKLTTVECAYGERPFELHNPKVHMVHVRANGAAMVWNKESLLNIGISRIPDAKYIATIDADIRFRKRYWASETVQELQHHQVVQPWSDCYDLGPGDEHLQAHRSFCRLVFDKQPIFHQTRPGHPHNPYRFGHPGYAWAWRREILDCLGGLIDWAPLGSADHHMALAMIGQCNMSMPGGVHDNYKKMLFNWQARAMQHIAKNISYVDGTIEHMWHGTKEKRKYVDRWGIITKHNYDPMNDIKRNTHGVVELAGNKPGFRHDIHLYLHERDEDQNSL